MTLRIVFNQQDLLRVRLADAADPMWELALGVQMAQAPAVPPPFTGWRQDFGRRFAGADRGRDAMALLRCLVNPVGPFPDFLTPPGPTADLDAGCADVLCAPRTMLTADLATVFAGRVAPAWVRSLAAGDREVMGDVVRAVRDSHDLLVAPHWTEVRHEVAVDRAMRARQLATHGVGALLANLPGVLSWDGQVLRTRYPVERTVQLGGRGMVLQPSYFCWGNPLTLLDPELPPVLVYQALGHRVLAEPVVSQCLVALLGRTRAECLRILLTPRSTTELAEHLGTSIGTASKQAAVLRDTGLVASIRRGATVLHSTTSLGVVLLTGRTAG